MTAAQMLASLLLPLIATDADPAEIGEAIADVYTADIGGVGHLADALAVALDEGVEAIEETEREALEDVGLLRGAYLPDYRAARRALGWA